MTEPMQTTNEITELAKYEEWCDKLLLKGKYTNTDYGLVQSPREWAEYKTIANLVQNLYQDKHDSEVKYQENKPEIMHIISEVVAMTIFYSAKATSEAVIRKLDDHIAAWEKTCIETKNEGQPVAAIEYWRGGATALWELKEALSNSTEEKKTV